MRRLYAAGIIAALALTACGGNAAQPEPGSSSSNGEAPASEQTDRTFDTSGIAKVDEIADFTELGDYLSMPLRTYSTGMRVRLAMGVVTSIDPEILLLDEGIGAVDAEFMKKARTRLQSLVARSGILVFASHSNEFLAQLCKTAMWVDHGTIRMTGGIEEVVGAYEGPDAARHVREVLAENARDDHNV